MEMHQTAAMALGLQYHQVEVDVPPVGGGFGGKTEQARFVVGPTAVAAKATKRPVRVAVPRDEDTAMIGKRHAYYGQYQIAVDRGDVRPEDKGIIHGFQLKMWGDGGAFYDCSFIVSNCIQLRTDNAYRVATSRARSTSAAPTPRRARRSARSATSRARTSSRTRSTTRPSRSACGRRICARRTSTTSAT